MQRVGRRVAVLLDADRMPVAKRDLAVVAAARDAGRARLLLSAVQPVRKAVVGRDVKHLRRGLVVPGAPRGAAVHRDRAALIRGDQHHVRVVRVDPDRVVVVAARRTLPRRERPPAVTRLVRGRVRRVDDVGVLRVDADVGEVVAAAPHARLVVHARPAGAGVVGPIDAADLARRGHPRVDAIRVARGDPDADAAQPLRRRREAARQRLPRRAAVGGLEQAARRPDVGVVVLPRALAGRPERRVHRLRVRRVEREIDRAGVLVFVENLLPGLSAVERAEHAALVVRTVRVAERGHEDAVGAERVDDHRADLPRFAQAEMRPRAAGIGRLVDAISDREVGALQSLAAAHVDHVRIGRRDRHGADRLGRLTVKQGHPRQPEVRRLPHPAVVHADVEHVRLLRHAGRADGASAAKRSDVAPTQVAEVGRGLGIDGRDCD